MFDGESETYHTYDAAGNRTAQHLVVGSVLRSSYFQYDRDNRTMRSIAADGGSTYFGYDLANNQTLATDPVGRPTYTAYDQLNRTYCRYDAQLNKTYWSYDARSSAVREIDPEGRAVYMGYDPARRLFHQSNALGEFSYFFYDARGARTHVLNPRGYSTYYRFDLLGRNTHREHALGGVAYMGYDEVGNQVLASDELGNSTYLTYDGLRRLTHSKDQAAGVTYMGYDNRSSLVRRVDANGRATYMGYDSARRLERQYFTNPVAGEAISQPTYFGYDQASNLLYTDDRLTDGPFPAFGALGITYFEYDKLDRLLKKKTGAGTVYYAYDLSGMKTSLKDTDFTESAYVYDAAGRLEKVNLAAGRTSYFAYDRAGLMTRKTFPGTLPVMAYYTYDVAARVKQLENKGPTGGDLINYFAYQRDPNGSITWIRHEGGQNTYYEYDALDRITLDDRKDSSATIYGFRYAYDQASRRTAKVTIHESNSRTYYEYNSLNLVTREWVDGGGDAAYYTYDSAQRMKAREVTGSGQSAYFSHNERDLISGISFAKASGVDYGQGFSYNGAGERVVASQTEPGEFGLTTFVTLQHDGAKVIREATDGTLNRRYRHNDQAQDAMGSLIEIAPASGPRLYPCFDQRGTVWRMPDEDGELRNTYLFDVFGNKLAAGEETSANPRLRFLTPGLFRLNLSNLEINLTPGRAILAAPALVTRGASQWWQGLLLAGVGFAGEQVGQAAPPPVGPPPPPWADNRLLFVDRGGVWPTVWAQDVTPQDFGIDPSQVNPRNQAQYSTGQPPAQWWLAPASPGPRSCGPDVTSWFLGQLTGNLMTIVRTWSWAGSELLRWKRLVQSKGDWDFKTSETLRIKGGCPTAGCEQTITLCNLCFFYDVLGNIHYGFVGAAAGFPTGLLHEGAGAAQQGRSAWWAIPLGYLGVVGNDDDPQDSAGIDLGISLFNNYGVSLNTGTLCQHVAQWEGRLRGDTWRYLGYSQRTWRPEAARTCPPCNQVYTGDRVPPGLR